MYIEGYNAPELDISVSYVIFKCISQDFCNHQSTFGNVY